MDTFLQKLNSRRVRGHLVFASLKRSRFYRKTLKLLGFNFYLKIILWKASWKKKEGLSALGREVVYSNSQHRHNVRIVWKDG
jgi:hypothetical protein